VKAGVPLYTTSSPRISPIALANALRPAFFTLNLMFTLFAPFMVFCFVEHLTIYPPAERVKAGELL
jgi:hypothetical protein